MLKGLLLTSLILSTNAFAGTNNVCSASVGGKSIKTENFQLTENKEAYNFKINDQLSVDAGLVEVCAGYDCSSSLTLVTNVGETKVKNTIRLNYKEVENSNKSYFPALEIESEGTTYKISCYQIN